MKYILSLIVLILALNLSCTPRREYRENVKQTITYKYKIVNQGYVYYTNEYKIEDNLIYFSAYRAGGKVHNYIIPIYSLQHIMTYE